MSESLGEAVEGLGSFLMENSEEDVEAGGEALQDLKLDSSLMLLSFDFSDKIESIPKDNDVFLMESIVKLKLPGVSSNHFIRRLWTFKVASCLTVYQPMVILIFNLMSINQ